MPSYTITAIDPENPAHAALVDAAHHGPFARTWPDYVELEDFRSTVMAEPDPSDPNKFLMLVAQDEAGEVVGMRYALYREDSQTAMGIYITVDQEHREHGLGTEMFEQALATLQERHPELRAFYVENTRPEHGLDSDGNPVEGMDAEARIAYFQKRGLEPVGFDYSQPFSFTDPDTLTAEGANGHAFDSETGANKQYLLAVRRFSEETTLAEAYATDSDFLRSLHAYVADGYDRDTPEGARLSELSEAALQESLASARTYYTEKAQELDEPLGKFTAREHNNNARSISRE